MKYNYRIIFCTENNKKQKIISQHSTVELANKELTRLTNGYVETKDNKGYYYIQEYLGSKWFSHSNPNY